MFLFRCILYATEHKLVLEKNECGVKELLFREVLTVPIYFHFFLDQEVRD
jgi:hypothetical protein